MVTLNIKDMDTKDIPALLCLKDMLGELVIKDDCLWLIKVYPHIGGMDNYFFVGLKQICSRLNIVLYYGDTRNPIR